MIFFITLRSIDKKYQKQLALLETTFEQIVSENNSRIEWLKNDITKYEERERQLLEHLNTLKIRKDTIKIYYEKEYEKIYDSSIDDHVEWFKDFMKSKYNNSVTK